MFKKIFSSCSETVEERLGSSMYGSLIVSWLLWNWEFIYVTFFVDQQYILDKTGLLKIDYILNSYHFLPFFWSGVWWIVRLVIGPIVSAYLINWQLSKIEYLFFRKSLCLDIEKKKEKIRQEETILKTEKQALKTKEEKIDIEKNIERKMSEEELWEKEYDALKNNINLSKALDALKKCLYTNNGNVHHPSRGRLISSEELALLDVNGIIEFSDEYRNKINTTKKGKTFLKIYIKEENEAPF